MNQVAHVADPLAPYERDAKVRQWRAGIALGYRHAPSKTVLAHREHFGPLRVQRPFYPEQDGCCHTYLLHPPGGMAVGDEVNIDIALEPNAKALLTTPSAGRMYGTLGLDAAVIAPQKQSVTMHVAAGAEAEWLPQETIVYNGAYAELNTTVQLEGDARWMGWDIVRLGRAASGERFEQGYCRQRLSVYRDGKPVFLEYNPVIAGEAFQHGVAGMRGLNTLATLVATVSLQREAVDALVEALAPWRSDASLWGVTQKESVLIVRYLGDSIMDCRAGLEHLWHLIRPACLNKSAVAPRIWFT